MTIGRVLVTGGTGMIGRAVVPLLVELGYKVRVLVRSENKPLPFNVPVETVMGDILDEASCVRATQRIDMVVHLAGRVHVRSEPQLFFKVNVDGTQNLLEAAGQNEVSRFVFMSSAGVYGDGRSQPFVETETPQPSMPYGLSKLMAEKLVAEKASRFGMAYTILRPSVVYGPGDRGNVLRMIQAIDRGLFATVGNGRTLKSMTHVLNVADVITLCLSDDRARNHILNVADPTSYAVGDLAQMIAHSLGKSYRSLSIPSPLAVAAAHCLVIGCRIFGREPLVTPRDVRVLSTDMVLEVGELTSVLGYRSRVLLSEGLQLTNEWYRRTKTID